MLTEFKIIQFINTSNKITEANILKFSTLPINV